jgi:hypothetical protein
MGWALCLFGVGVGFSWVAASALLIGSTFIWLGYQLAGEKVSYDRQRLRAQRQALDAEWQALEQTGRVRSIFLHARRAMQQEAQQRESDHPDPGGPDYG